jgi:ABC-type phosphate transport system substrate-binding protein
MTMAAASSHADVVVVVSAKSTVNILTTEQISKIFLGKVDNFPNAEMALAIDQAEGSAIRDEFYTKVVHKGSTQLTAYWAKMIFTGDGRPPQMLEGNLAVRQAVAGNPNAIGYIDRSAVDSSVRVVLSP